MMYTTICLCVVCIHEGRDRVAAEREDNVLIHHYYITCSHFGGRDPREPEEGETVLLIYIYNYIQNKEKDQAGVSGMGRRCFCFEYIYILKEGSGESQWREKTWYMFLLIEHNYESLYLNK